MPDIEWRPVVGWEGHYEVSDTGLVRSVDRFIDRVRGPYWAKGQLINPYISVVDGRPRINLRRATGTVRHRHIQVSSLVAEAFLGPRPEGMECCHGDDVPTNNHVSNLRWDTPAANKFDAVRNGVHGMARKTHCKWGHEFTPANTIIPSDKKERGCRACHARRNAKYRANRVAS